MKFIDCLPRKRSAMRDYKSPEKSLIINTFNSLSYMDMWISSIVEGYIYEKVNKIDEKGYREEYTERYDGEKEGEYKKWKSGENGQLYIQKYYKEGYLDGEFKVWYENGQLWFQKYYKEGEYHGEYKRWWSNGQLSCQEYYKEGKEEGEHKKWYPNGEIEGQLCYKEGKLDGESKQWYDNGQLAFQCYYKEGEKDGELKTWYPNGKLGKHIIYKEGIIVKVLLGK